MKQLLKHGLSRSGLLPGLDLARRLPEISSWIRGGCIGIAPPPVKRLVLSAYLARYALSTFVETGTHLGDTLAYITRNRHVRATSIELDLAFYQAATRRFAGYPNVSLLHGDSGTLLPALVRDLKAPALFWLDGHYSGDLTARGSLDTPISAELESILASDVEGHVILIDDARCFDGTNDYPHLDRLLELVRRRGRHHAEVSTDIIRLTPIGPRAIR